MTRSKVMVADSSISAPQMMDFWRKIGDGSIDGIRLQRFLHNPSWDSDKTEVTLARAINILGEQKIVSIDLAAKARKIGVGFIAEFYNRRIRYSEMTLRECAEQNRDGDADWRLTYCFGFSLRELRDQIGTDPKSQPCCYSNDWWLKKQEDEWATAKPETGYYLVDFNGRFARTSWNNQEREIAKLGGQFFRTPEAVIAEAITTIFQVHKERLLEEWYHWGSSLGSGGGRVFVGLFVQKGWDLYGGLPDYDSDGDLRVCIAQKFQS
ncbi:MAG: hypothetical protein AAB407_02555 [Patescibacteria group bacterium]